MTINRLPQSVATLYSELLDQAILLERESTLAGHLPGGIVSKSIRGNRYLYWQVRKGDQVAQRYLGPDNEELRTSLARVDTQRSSVAEQRASLDRLSAMALQGGAFREEPRVAEILALLADLGLFRRGAVLVGTQAYRTYANVLAVHLSGASLRTQDIDVAHAIDVAVAAAGEGEPDIEGALRSVGLLPVPGLDPRHASTSFHLRGRELRVDFLTPQRRRAPSGAEPVPIPGLGITAWPLPFLDYLLEGPIQAVVLAARPILVRLPRPARFALHKLWTAADRPPSEQAKTGKDRSQAAALLTVLMHDRPDDVVEALTALRPRRTAFKRVTRELAVASPETLALLDQTGPGQP